VKAKRTKEKGNLMKTSGSLLTLICAASASLLTMVSCAPYTVTLEQIGPNVVAISHGLTLDSVPSSIDLTGLTFSKSLSENPSIQLEGSGTAIFTGGSSNVDAYVEPIGPTSFGSGFLSTSASSGSGDMVGLATNPRGNFLVVPRGYVSKNPLSKARAIYRGKTLASLGVKPGSYLWNWGPEIKQEFKLVIPHAINISNISTRASVQTGESVTIAGFIVLGTEPKQVVIRGLGPTLTNLNLTGVLADPTLELLDGSRHLLSFNDNWKTKSDGTNQQAAIEATDLAPSFDVESAILITLQPGKYTAILSGSNGTTGVGLVEIYEADTPGTAPASELFNVSTRGFVGGGDSVLIAGFIASGGDGNNQTPCRETCNQVLVRGLGPTLAQFGVSGTLADPVLTLVDGNGNVVQSNNNWKDTDEAAIAATGKAPHNDLEAAILAPVAAGNYTAILSGNGGGTGIGLLEVYK
jgi:hypothetical protein